MSNSFERDGSAVRLCLGTTAGAGSGGDPGLLTTENEFWTPNTYLGSPLDTNILVSPVSGTRFPSIVVGTENFAIEFWAKFFSFAEFDNDAYMGIGFTGTGNGPFGFLSFVGGASPIRPTYADGAAVTAGGFLAAPRGWHHWVINFEKVGTGNMTTHLDGTVVDTTAIPSGTSGTMSFHPLAFSSPGTVGDVTDGTDDFDVSIATDPGGTFPDSLTDPFTVFDFPHLPCVIGPIAMHVGVELSGVLSTTEIADSIARRDVHNFVNDTEILYRWKDIVFDNARRWDGNRRHAIRGITDFADHAVGIPRGLDSSIRVPDLSNAGSDHPLRLQTTEIYGQETVASLTAVQDGLRGWHAFMTDPFFATGGGAPPAT